jgi:3-oxoacyl-[acyl-carrier-protein] synthase III
MSGLTRGAYVDGFSYALGEHKRDVDQTEADGRLVSSAADLRSAGFAWHHVCGPETTAYDLAWLAVSGLVDEDRLGEIDAIVYATCLTLNGNLGAETEFHRTADVKHLMDYPGSRLQAALGSDRAVVIGLNQQACTSMLGSIRIANALLAIEPGWERILCVTADRFPEGAHYEQAYNLISDGAAACTVSRAAGRFRLMAAHHITNGALAQATDDETVGSYFSFTHRLIAETLARAQLAATDLDWVVPQNTNENAWRVLGPLLGIDAGRVWSPSLADVGHVISGDNVVNLVSLLEAGLLRPGHRLLLPMAGFGLNWQALVLEATAEVDR